MSGDFTFLKGNIDTIILCALYKSDKYGYEIAKEIKERTENRYEIKQPTLYSYLKRLEENGLIESYWGESSNGGRRRYYKLTPQGKSDSEQFVSEWQYQKSLMSDLVDDTAVGREVTQKDVTPLFGRKTPAAKKRNHKNSMQDALNEQDEIARRLKELAGEQEEDSETVSKPEQLTIFDLYSSSAAASDTEPLETSENSVAHDSAYEAGKDEITATVAATPSNEANSEQERESAIAKFDVKQDNADEFIQGFDALAHEVSSRDPVGSDVKEGENYQHVLLNVLGDQLDGMQDEESLSSRETYYSDHPAALEEVADSLAKEGIRIRIYNHATATYKSKVLMPLAKVLCQTAWISYIFSLIYFGIFAVTSIDNQNWLAMVIAGAASILIPVAFSVYAIFDPTRKPKPPFNYSKMLLATLLFTLVVFLLALGISILTKIEFSNSVAVSNQIMIPLGVALYPPVFVTVFKFLYKKY